ncbi:sensor histidine kinase, PAS domain-containing [Desulfuromonas soudanensis]|uniref:histidine kinase n=1 Tax=Desulfuromonas soudanensis TaxID=1603606 RepID=A0A0M4CXW5_9BACT|nr:ATP-binding protein [Desulfuromonas soudanensis]ALC15127.1 sensor histidine kinase, PAS domain-containing [Desulfuromonas soudanensis]
MQPTKRSLPPKETESGELARLAAENAELRRNNRDAFDYIRAKTNQLLNTMGTRSLPPEELADWSLLEFDPIGIVAQSFQHVLENIRETNERLQLAHQEVQAVFEAVGAAVLVLDPQMRIIAYNDRVRTLLLNAEGDMTGVLCQEVVCRSKAGMQDCVHSKVLASGRPEASADFYTNGRFFDVIGQPILDPQGRVTRVVLAYNDVTEHKRSQSDLLVALDAVRRAKEQIDTLLRTMSDGLVATDGKRRIVLMNQAAEELLGLCLHESLGRPLLDVIRHAGLRAHLEAVARGEAQVLTDMEFVIDGQKKVFQARTTAFSSTVASDQGRITLLHDVTRARDIERVKDEFLSTAAHQLRTPLTSVIGYSDLLIEADDDIGDDARLEYLRQIHAKAEQLSEIVSNLLDISRIEAGEGVTLTCQAHSAALLCRDAIAGFRYSLSGHRIDLTVEDDDMSIRVDHFAVLQVLENLLSNAMKYSPPGSPVVVSLRGDNGMCHISVCDQGIGMTEEQAAQAFDKFYRADASNTAIAGTGLGLTIVRHLVEAHGGRVSIDSRVGEGTAVHCTFPLAGRVQSP